MGGTPAAASPLQEARMRSPSCLSARDSFLASASPLRKVLFALFLSIGVALLLLLRLPFPQTVVAPSPSSSLPTSLSLVHPLLPFFSLGSSDSLLALPASAPAETSSSSPSASPSAASVAPWWLPWSLSAGPAWWVSCPADTARRLGTPKAPRQPPGFGRRSRRTPQKAAEVPDAPSEAEEEAEAEEKEGRSRDGIAAAVPLQARWEHRLPESARQALAVFALQGETENNQAEEEERRRKRTWTCSNSGERSELYDALQEVAFSNYEFPPFLEVFLCVTLINLSVWMFNAFSRCVASFSAWRSQRFSRFGPPSGNSTSEASDLSETPSASAVAASSSSYARVRRRPPCASGATASFASPFASASSQKSSVDASPPSPRSHLSLLVNFLVNFALLVLPLLLGFCLPNALLPVSVGVGSLTVAFLLPSWIRRIFQLLETPKTVDASLFETDSCGRILALAEFRGALMIATCIAIYGVDFFIFPRSLAKTSAFGVSLMDLGVGCFVFSAGLVSRQARGEQRSKVAKGEQKHKETGGSATSLDGAADSRGKVEKVKSRKRNCLTRGVFTLLRAVGRSGVLGFAGILRFAAVSLLNYYTPVTEYGKHWNFYMSLMVLFIAAELLLPGSSSRPFLYVPMGVALASVYQLLLWAAAAETWVLTADRDNFFTANREGILGCVGFFALYMIGVGVGSLFFSAASLSSRRPVSEEGEKGTAAMKSQTVSRPPSRFALIAVLLSAAVCFYLYALVLAFYFDLLPTRRLINLPWVLLVAALNLYGLAGVLLSEALVGRGPAGASYLVSGLSQNQIFIFLIANVLCGLTGLSMNRLLVPPALALSLLLLYALSWAFVAFGLGYLEKRIPLNL
ncbi:putative GPI-anchored wall transfer protein GWT1 [Toxoplasma gondii ARI]|uniref:Putative GPI-anchored wall transfer protein GWT1 n=1 Tax=Toxoplasma gondii ARI TaxID=1074872 RepID=A0A139XVS8_TOXGO|nr:putative GPI-anchored wall transfer protein GWT1 [Toxoplasma gondii ARI]